MGDALATIAAPSGMPVKIVASYGRGENMHRIVASADFPHSQGKITSMVDWSKTIDSSFVLRMNENE